MTLICFASQKGSPGATATALAVTASLKLAPGRRKLLLEADLTGGTLAIRYRLPVEPGLLTLAAAVRGGLDTSDGLWRHTQELPGGLPVILCPDGPEQVHAALAAGGAQLGRFLNRLRDVDVMCDVGRLAPDSPALPFVAEASAVLMVARPTAEQLQPAARRMLMLRPLVSNLGWVLVGEKPYGPLDVESTYDFPVVGLMADDARSVLSLEQGTVSKRLRRQPFIRSATTLADTLSDWLAPLTTASPQSSDPTESAPPVEPAAVSAVSATDSSSSRGQEQGPAPDVPGPSSPPNTERGMVAAPESVEPAENGTGEAPGAAPAVPVDLGMLPPPTGEPDTETPAPAELAPAPVELTPAPVELAPVEPSTAPAADLDGAETEPFGARQSWPEPPAPEPAPPGRRSDTDLEFDAGFDGEADQEADAAPLDGFDRFEPPAELGWHMLASEQIPAGNRTETELLAPSELRPVEPRPTERGEEHGPPEPAAPRQPPAPTTPPLPPPSTRIRAAEDGVESEAPSRPPTAFPHEDVDGDWSDW